MSIDRRFVLKSASLSTLAALTLARADMALAATRAASMNNTHPVLVLTNDSTEPSPAEAAFLQGAYAAQGHALQLQRVDYEPKVIRALERQLRSDETMQVIGLLHDGLATLVVDAARSAGARMQWLSLHKITPNAVHHRLLNADADVCSCDTDASSMYWLTELAHVLAGPTLNSAMLPKIESRSGKAISGSFVSFSIAVGRPNHG